MLLLDGLRWSLDGLREQFFRNCHCEIDSLYNDIHVTQTSFISLDEDFLRYFLLIITTANNEELNFYQSSVVQVTIRLRSITPTMPLLFCS